MRSPIYCASIVVAVTLMAGARAQAFDPDQVVRPKVAGEHDCNRGDYQLAFSHEAYETLKRRGLEHLPTAKCRAISLYWLPEANIVQMTGWQQTDVFVSVTLVRAKAASKIRWIISTGGLSIPLNPEDKPENKDTFNDLLSESSAPRTELQMMDLAELYMWMVGHSPDETPRKFLDALKVDDLAASVQAQQPKVTVVLHQRMSLIGRPPKREWRLEFRSDKDKLRLVSVSKEHA